jgi:hypothetical protein
MQPNVAVVSNVVATFEIFPAELPFQDTSSGSSGGGGGIRLP